MNEKDMLNFTVGPVMASASVRAIGAEQVPYFRTPAFSQIMKENESRILTFAGAGEGSRAVFITGSGTASMEASVMNVFDETDRVLVIDGGSFGHRFVQLCEIHGIPHTVIVPEFGYGITEKQLAPYEGQGYTGFLVNLDETSVGVLYDLDLISDFCSRNHIFLVVDAISSFLCDPIDMVRKNVQVLITGSQKALACPPGISVIMLSEAAVSRVQEHRVRSLYFDLKAALLDGERGQTPFTPAVGTLLQIHQRLLEIEEAGGAEAEIARCRALAQDFRTKVKALPFEMVSHSMSNAVTPLHPVTASAYDIFTILKDEYRIWVCPNGGKLRDTVLRVGHIGALTPADNDQLIDALKDMQARGLI